MTRDPRVHNATERKSYHKHKSDLDFFKKSATLYPDLRKEYLSLLGTHFRAKLKYDALFTTLSSDNPPSVLIKQFLETEHEAVLQNLAFHNSASSKFSLLESPITQTLALEAAQKSTNLHARSQAKYKEKKKVEFDTAKAHAHQSCMLQDNIRALKTAPPFLPMPSVVADENLILKDPMLSQKFNDIFCIRIQVATRELDNLLEESKKLPTKTVRAHLNQFQATMPESLPPLPQVSQISVEHPSKSIVVSPT